MNTSMIPEMIMRTFATFSQIDPAYAGIPLGISNTTIGGFGCLLCSLSSALFDWGILIDDRNLDPALLNRWLARNGGYTASPSAPSQQNRFVFGSVSGRGVQFEGIIDCSAVPAPIDKIAHFLVDPECAILAEVDFKPGGLRQQHWVRLLPEWVDITEGEQLERLSNDVVIMDPWMPPGSEFRWLMPSYAIPSWNDPARALFRLAIYRHEDQDAAPATPVVGGDGLAQGPVNLRVPQIYT